MDKHRQEAVTTVKYWVGRRWNLEAHPIPGGPHIAVACGSGLTLIGTPDDLRWFSGQIKKVLGAIDQETL